MKKFLLATTMLFFLALHVNAQERYFTRAAKVNFLSEAAEEKISGKNAQATSVFDAKTGQLEFAILMKAFEFEKALLMEHFNENYVESTKYPKAIFKGMITDIAMVDFSKDGVYPVNYKGALTMHGVTKDITGKGILTLKGGKVSGHSDFKILLADYKIEIPALVKEKVAKEVQIVVDAAYDKMQ